MPLPAGTTLLDDQGKELLDEDGKGILTDGVSDCECCTIYCVQVLHAQLQCNADGHPTGYNVTEELTEMTTAPAVQDTWIEDWPNRFCSPLTRYHVYATRQGLLGDGGCAEFVPPDPVAAPATPTYKCSVCGTVVLSRSQVQKIYINGTLCSTTPSGPVDYRFKVKADMCGHLSTDWVECLIWDLDDWVEGQGPYQGTAEKIKIYYQASSDSFRVCNLKIPVDPGDTVISRTCDEEGTSTLRCCAVVGETDTQVQFVHYQSPMSLVIGTWSDCLGRNIQEGDTGYIDMEATETARVSVLEDCMPKTCYHTKYATCTEVAPGVKIWIPGSVVVECLDAAPGTLNTWGWVNATTAKIIRQGGECYDEMDCGTGAPETPGPGDLTCA